MTTDRTEYQRANLDFFRSFVFGASIEEMEFHANHGMTSFLRPDQIETRILMSKGLIEAALWMKLGLEAGFLDIESVSQFLVTLERPLSFAWRYLVERNARPPDTWCDFLSDGPGFIQDKFFEIRPPEIGPLESLSSEQYDRLSQCFLGCLLLTSEVIFEPRTMMFLEKIGWASDNEWNALIQGYSEPIGSRMEDLYIGLANHARYSEQLFNHLLLYGSGKSNIEAPEISNIVAPAISYIEAPEIHSLFVKVEGILTERLKFSELATNRFLQLVDEILGMLNQPGPEWQHVRLAILQEISLLTELDKSTLYKWWSDNIERLVGIGRANRRRRDNVPFEGSSFATE